MPKSFEVSFEVDVNPDVIKWARETAGWTIEEIANKLKISPEVCEKIEQGIVKPTCKQIEKFAYHYRLPVFAFFLPELPTEEPNSVLFSLLPFSEESFSKELRFSIREAKYYQYIANEIIRDLGIEPDVNISKYEIKDDPVKAAQNERKNIKIKIEDQKKWKDEYYAFNPNLVLVVKYRRRVITQSIGNRLREIFESIGEKHYVALEEWGYEKEFPEIRRYLWKEYFWSRSYCLLTSGGAPIEVKYI